MFAFMMVVSMSCNVKAAGTGKITISPANPNEEYKIYKILNLESYDETKQLYSYTKTGEQQKREQLQSITQYLNRLILFIKF